MPQSNPGGLQTRLQIESQISALMQLRGELQSQRGTLQRQRNGLDEQRLASPDGSAARRGFEGRIAAIDARTAAIDKQSLDIDAQITAAQMKLVQLAGQPVADVVSDAPQTVIEVPPPPPPGGVDVGRIVGINAVVVVVLILATYRYAVRRLEKRQAKPALSDEKVMQLQQSIDTIAIEVERISEAQRYLSKTISEKSQVSR